MGYTHYWGHRAFSPEEWTRVTAGARQVIARAEKRGIALAGPDGSGRPSVSDLNVVLNGAGRGDCEPFQLTRAEPGRGFCRRGGYRTTPSSWRSVCCREDRSARVE